MEHTKADICITHKTGNPQLDEMFRQSLDSLTQSETETDFNIITRLDDGTKPFNYNRFMADGLKSGTAPWTIMANDDLIYCKEWFSRITEAYDKFLGQYRSFGVWNPKYHDRIFHEEQKYYSGYRVTKEVTGWCIVCRRDVLEEINFFTHKTFYKVRGWFSDDLYADALREHGIRHLLVRDSHVIHLNNQTMKTLPAHERYQLQQGQKENYLQK